MWISVEDHPPIEGQCIDAYVSGYMGGRYPELVFGNGKFHKPGAHEIKNVTHWMPLPQPPSERDE